ncbi:importin subunit beta-1 [Nicotiana attenuata]|uniref:Importin subunit beta-1 n=1 Tax=Nicotiana attenuata TaxID=49451 RepID=A0A314LDM6_NICAT|nr:importin subunit beta-1 [Nicotiana attenuata]
MTMPVMRLWNVAEMGNFVVMDSELTQLQKDQMEAILGSESEPFETFISDHIESSEEKDSEAKSMFEMMKQKDPDSFALKLAEFLGPSHDLYYREECAVLLNKLLTDDDDDDLCTWRDLSLSTQSTIKFIMLNRMSLEESEFIILKLTNIVSKLAASLLPNNKWPELFPFLYQCLTDDSTSNNHLKFCSFLVFGMLADDIGETIVPCIKNLHPLFLNTLNDDTLFLNARIAATRAVISFIQCVPANSNENERFQDLLPGMMRTLTDGLSIGDQEDLARYVLDFFIELAKNEPRFFRRQLVVVVGSVSDIAEDEKLQEGTRHLAVEFLITLVEARERTPGMMKKLPLFISRCFTMLLNLLLDIKDDPAWHNAKDVDDDTGTTSNHHVGKKCLERFSIALGGKSISYIAIEQLCAYAAAPDWKKRYAALFALAQIAEGCSKLVMIKNLEQLVNIVLNCLQDPHLRVRLAACEAIARLSKFFCPNFQEQYHNQVVPALTAAVDDKHQRVQACAAGALSAFCGPVKPETLLPYLDGIVNKLLVLLQNGEQMVQEEALWTLSRLAQCVGEHFRTYYDTVMPHLKAVSIKTDLNLILRARAMECISFVGFAGGKEKFREDAEQAMEVLISLQGLQTNRDDPPTKYLLIACTRICNCLEQDFLPYMSAVMPFMIHCAQLEPAATSFAGLVLRGYAMILEEDFYPWIPQVVSVFVPLLKFYYHNEVRNQAAKAMAPLLRSAKLAVEKGIAQDGSESYFTKLSGDIILSMVEALHEEPMTEICAVMLDELNSCLQICGPLLNESQLRLIVDELKHVITESSNRKGKLAERAKTEDFDAEEAELLKGENMQEDLIFSHVGAISDTLIKNFKVAFLHFFDELSSYLFPMWGKDITAQERCTSIYIFGGLVEECPEAALKYCDVFLPLFLDASNDKCPTIRQCALYGLGLYAEYGGSVFKPFVREATSRINVVIMHFRARELENEHAYDNAVSALGKICQFHRESIDSAQVCPYQIPKVYMFMHSYDLMVIYTWVGILKCKVYI